MTIATYNQSYLRRCRFYSAFAAGLHTHSTTAAHPYVSPSALPPGTNFLSGVDHLGKIIHRALWCLGDITPPPLIGFGLIQWLVSLHQAPRLLKMNCTTAGKDFPRRLTSTLQPILTCPYLWPGEWTSDPEVPRLDDDNACLMFLSLIDGRFVSCCLQISEAPSRMHLTHHISNVQIAFPATLNLFQIVPYIQPPLDW